MWKQWLPNIVLINLICWTFQFQNLLLFAKILASSTIDWKIEKQNRVHQSMWHFQFIYTIIHLVELDPIIAQFKSIWISFNYIHVALAFRTHTHTMVGWRSFTFYTKHSENVHAFMKIYHVLCVVHNILPMEKQYNSLLHRYVMYFSLIEFSILSYHGRIFFSSLSSFR